MKKYVNADKIIMPIKEFAKWLDSNGQHDNSPWIMWFDSQYCSKCEPEIVKREDSMSKLGFKLLFKNETECSYCEIHKKCRYFPDMEEIPSNTDIIEMWLKEEE